jgi:hypothetical protein
VIDDATKRDIEKRRVELQQEINAFMRQVRDVNNVSRDRVNELRRRVGLYVVGVKIEEIRSNISFPPGC